MTRRGDGQSPVRARRESAPEPRDGGEDFFDAHLVEKIDGSHYVHDQIRRAHLVKMDLLDPRAVHPCLGFGQAVEDFNASLFNFPRKPASLEHLLDFTDSGTMSLLRRGDGELRATDKIGFALPR